MVNAGLCGKAVGRMANAGQLSDKRMGVDVDPLDIGHLDVAEYAEPGIDHRMDHDAAWVRLDGDFEQLITRAETVDHSVGIDRAKHLRQTIGTIEPARSGIESVRREVCGIQT
jgi:hypothetical protein